jgi:glutamate-1-semialdehyde 2,1-aminomutase
MMELTRSLEIQDKFHSIIPGGSHTYAKGDDQYPEQYPLYIDRGKGCHVWDLDGNKFIEYGMGLRAVTLGHAYEPVNEAVRRQLELGNNFVRPALLELECAEELLSCISGAEMVKFGKNGSDVTDGAIRLSRAYTGRDLIAVCENHPFFSVNDWFIGTTPMNSGIPKAIQDLTVKFRYDDIQSVRDLFETYPNQVAALIMEPDKGTDPKDNFLHETKKLCELNGAVFIFDEMITGFRWHLGGGQAYHGVIPDLSTFGKGIANGFSVSALLGKKEIMELGGIRHDRERVFLLSLTHGAEGHCLAAAQQTIRTYKQEPVIETLWNRGRRLAEGIQRSIEEHHLDGYFTVSGKPSCLVYGTCDQDKKPSQKFRTLFLQETIKRGILAPSLILSYSHTDDVIDQTVEIIHEALAVYRKALDEGVEKYLKSRPVQPVWRLYNNI